MNTVKIEFRIPNNKGGRVEVKTISAALWERVKKMKNKPGNWKHAHEVSTHIELDLDLGKSKEPEKVKAKPGPKPKTEKGSEEPKTEENKEETELN